MSEAIAWAVSSDPTTRSQILEWACGLGPQTATAAGVSSLDICRDALETGSQQVLQYAQRQTLMTLRGLTDVIRGVAAAGSPSAIVIVSTGM